MSWNYLRVNVKQIPLYVLVHEIHLKRENVYKKYKKWNHASESLQTSTHKCSWELYEICDKLLLLSSIYSKSISTEKYTDLLSWLISVGKKSLASCDKGMAKWNTESPTIVDSFTQSRPTI